MSYVPIVTPHVHVPSHSTRELADQLAGVIVEFEQTHPTMSKGEIREAAQLAVQVASPGGGARPLVFVLAAGVVLFIASLVAFGVQSGVIGADQPFPIIAVVAIMVVIIGLVAIVLRRSP